LKSIDNPFSTPLTSSGITESITLIPSSTIPLLGAAVYNNKDTCLIKYLPVYSGYKSITYYVNDIFTEDLSLTLSTYFTKCNTGICATENYGIFQPDPVSTLTITMTNGIHSISTADASLIGKTYNVLYRAVPPTGSITNCVYYTLARYLKIDTLSITANA
jgi:hypothetical protein